MPAVLRRLSLFALGGVAAALIPLGTASAEPGTVGGAGLAGAGVVVGAGALSAPPDGAPTWLIADAASGKVLAAKGAHQRRAPASVLKTLTALTLMPRLDPAQTVTATTADAAQEGSKVGMVPGATYTVADLWHGLMLPSGNDAAHALGAAAGGQTEAVAMMNAEAKRLQALDTAVVNTSGLDAPGQWSSAYDLALIARAGLQRPDFADLVNTISADFPGKPAAAGQPRPTYKIYNQNRLLRRGYDGAIGVKTGFTTQARFTFAGAAERDGRTLLVTVLGAPGRAETVAASLLDWGFANVETVAPAGVLVDPTVPAVSVSVSAASAETVPAVASTDVGTASIAGGVLLGAGLLVIGFGLTEGRRPRTRVE